ncbi:MAG: hypothetical protein JW863_07340 [Chitinispirillaceae bacterium]|nr:hypothetical protein [Chitinispirillaceae bacterium]
MFFRTSLLLKTTVVLLLAAVTAFCFDIPDEAEKKVEFFGSAEIQAGLYKNFKYLPNGYELTNKWMQDNILTMGIRSKINDRLSGDVSLKAWLYFNPFPDSLMNNRTQDMNAPTIDFYMLSARMKLRLSPDPADSLVNLEIGIFPYKYNQEVRNLGEYMFRTGCYPGYIHSEGFDLAGRQLSGIHVQNNLFDGAVKNDLFFTSELYLYPSKDFSLTLLTDITPVPNRVINIGAGVQLFRCLPVDDAYTTPTKYEQMYGSFDEKVAPNWYITNSGDTAYYTFAGTKIMARLAFDPKPLFGLPDIFGPEDLKLYSEAIILGAKDYPVSLDSSNFYGRPINEFGYDKLLEKMPIMVGFNFPAFKLLDVLSMEVEYYGKKYVNRVPIYANSNNMLRLPLPYDPRINQGYPYGDSLTHRPEASGEYSMETYTGGAAQWKWSIYAKRTLFEKFDITLQFARDHTLIKTGLAQNVDFEEIFIKAKQWYWMLKFGYSF